MVNIVKTLDHTFADEWQLPDLILQPSEARRVRRAAERLGMELHHTPTGRTNQMVLRAALDYAIYQQAHATNRQAKRAWQSAVLRARYALGNKSFN